ncbi:hypothetical protein BFS14_01920 [Serratia fonticola]|uniref:hypothetical protein n=1 Tax=Serratia fonticola TaxID=47917 RepID=UPI0008FD56F7|nr:hypothetical protein [Serratia fonticola]OIX96245.1 hypothetical protein BFS14_01920 [Serratia fonticola]QCR60833.1 hypothetical protein FD644_10850 [Serratia fonticola]
MTFVSQKKSTRTRYGGTFITFKVNKNGGCASRIASGTGLNGKTVDIQVCEETKRVRVKESDEGFRVHKTGALTMSGDTYLAVAAGRTGKIQVALNLNDDGWWYGSYAQGDNHG